MSNPNFNNVTGKKARFVMTTPNMLKSKFDGSTLNEHSIYLTMGDASNGISQGTYIYNSGSLWCVGGRSAIIDVIGTYNQAQQAYSYTLVNETYSSILSYCLSGKIPVIRLTQSNDDGNEISWFNLYYKITTSGEGGPTPGIYFGCMLGDGEYTSEEYLRIGPDGTIEKLYVFSSRTLADLTDTNISSPQSGEILVYENGYWVNHAMPTPDTIGKLRTDASTSLTPSSSAGESLSDTVRLHKVSKTGKFGDLTDVDMAAYGYNYGDHSLLAYDNNDNKVKTSFVYTSYDSSTNNRSLNIDGDSLIIRTNTTEDYHTKLAANSPWGGNTLNLPSVDGTLLTDYSTVVSAYDASFSTTQEQVKFNTTDQKMYVDKTIFEGTITKNQGTYTCDKTYAQLLEAYNNGQVVRVKYSYQVDDLADMCGLYYLSNVEDTISEPLLVFTLSDPINFRYTPPTEFSVLSDNTWSSETVMPFSTNNVGTIPTSSGYTEVKYSTADGKLYSATSPETAIGSLNTTFTASQATSASESFGSTINLHKVSKTGNLYDLVNVEYGETSLNRTNLTFTSEYTPTQIKSMLDNYGHFFAFDANSNTYVPASYDLDGTEVEMYFNDVNASGDLATYCVKSSGDTWTVIKHESPKRFIVTATEVDDGEGNMILSMDKTIVEIYQVYNSNSYTAILCNYNGVLLQLTQCMYDEESEVGIIRFSSFYGISAEICTILFFEYGGQMVGEYFEYYLGDSEFGSAAYLDATGRYESPEVGTVPVLVEESGNYKGVLPYDVYGNDIKTSVFSASSASEMKAHSSATQGDICLRTDTNSSYILKNDNNYISNWVELLAPQSDWNQTDTTKQDYIKNKPTIPTVNNATLTIQKNGTTVNTFTANASSNVTANITVPTKDSDLTNDRYVRYDTNSQGLTDTQKTNARTNIGAGTSSFSGSYDDLTNKPSIPAAQVNSDWNANSGVAQILNKPSLATVATSGSYNDLSNKPTIPSAQVQTDWNATTGMGVLLNKPSLATVATSGSYDDLSDKPTIPTVNNATLTIQKNGTTVNTFTANASSNVTANITVPTKDSDLTNDRYVRYDINSQGLTAAQKTNARTNIGAGTSNFSGSYNDLTNKPTIPTVNDGTVTLKQGGVTKGSFSLNQADSATINLDSSEIINISSIIFDHNQYWPYHMPYSGSIWFDFQDGNFYEWNDSSADFSLSTAYTAKDGMILYCGLEDAFYIYHSQSSQTIFPISKGRTSYTIRNGYGETFSDILFNLPLCDTVTSIILDSSNYTQTSANYLSFNGIWYDGTEDTPIPGNISSTHTIFLRNDSDTDIIFTFNTTSDTTKYLLLGKGFNDTGDFTIPANKCVEISVMLYDVYGDGKGWPCFIVSNDYVMNAGSEQ